MKKLVYLFSITFLTLQSCSSGVDNNETINSNSNNSSVVVDKDGNSYQTVKICNQTWMKSNLNVTRYSNGDIIPQVTDPVAWAKLTTGAWCYYMNSSADGGSFGKLYNWYAVNDPRGLAPQGWHIPSEKEALTLIECLGGWEVAGGKMKSNDGGWSLPNLGATNSSAFTSISLGVLNSGCPGNLTPFASFTNKGYYADWWTSTSIDNEVSAAYKNIYNKTSCYTYLTCKTSGFSVRCIKN